MGHESPYYQPLRRIPENSHVSIALAATLFFFFCACVPRSSDAAGPTPAVVSSAAPIDLQTGDYIHLQESATFKKIDPARPEKEVGDVCLRSHTALRYLRSLTDINSIPPGKTVLEFRRETRETLKAHVRANMKTNCNDPSTELVNPKVDSNVYRIYQGDLPPEYYKHFGLTHGALFVPFKRRPDKSLSGESSLGYFVGYRMDVDLGVALTPIVTAGVSLVNVSNDSAITATSTLQDSGVRPAFTYGVGLILTHLGSFQIGAIYAWDRIGGEDGTASRLGIHSPADRPRRRGAKTMPKRILAANLAAAVGIERLSH